MPASTRENTRAKEEVGLTTTEGRAKPFVPKDVNGKPILQSKRWLYSTPASLKSELQALTISAALSSAFVAFSVSTTGRNFYEYLDTTYGAYNVNLWGTFIVTTVFFWVGGLIFAIPDLTGWPKWLFKYKTQPFVRVTPKEYARIMAVSMRNQVFVALPLIFAMTTVQPPRPVTPSALPSAPVMLATVLFDVFCTEMGFYYIHRMFHSSLLYQLFHKQHHEFTAPVALASTYCTVTEHIFSNLLPNALGTIVVPHHWSQACFAFVILEFGTLCAHSGYNIPLLPSNLQHDYHHFAFDENFGPIGLFDALHKTNKKFVKTVAEAQSRTGCDESARQLVLERLATMEVEDRERAAAVKTA
ncbi:hypothetical protein MSPP1_003039 [Malassezia sp. CBS 17886]|nr:hypothetical protein MSPP1_003039 [Malassezia sp. CBS 17886]